MKREILEKPFGPEQIKQREGNFGKMLDYVEGHSVIQRLNDAFEGDWSFAIIKHEILTETDEVLVLGKLMAGEVVKSQFGSSRITRNRQNGELVSLSDDLKAAATDALKKCATLLGVGLHLYQGDNGKKHQRGPNHYQGRYSAPGGNHNQRASNSGGPDNGNGGGRISGNQYKYMIRLTQDQGRSKEDLDRQCLQMFGTVAQYLSKKDASAMIDQLLSH